MESLKVFLSGKKTYLVSLAAVVYAIGGAVAGFHDWSRATEIVLGSLGLGTLRAGVSKSNH